MTGATHVRVLNTNDEPIDDRFDGIVYVFEPGVAKTISLEAAALFFNFETDADGNVSWNDKWHLDFARRHGWTNMEPQKDERPNDTFLRITQYAAEKCAKIKLEPVSYTLREVTAEETLDAPRDPAAEPIPPAMLADADGAEKRKPSKPKMTVG